MAIVDITDLDVLKYDDIFIENIENIPLIKGPKGDTGERGPIGPQGNKGDKGDKGEPNILSIGTVKDGETANATIEGNSPNQILNLVLPRGEKGEKGEKGDSYDDTKIKADIEELKTENKRLREDLNNSTITSPPSEGENITINDSTEARFKKLVVKGNSWQETDDTKPSPEFESPIRNCGDNVNLFDKDNAEVLSMSSDSNNNTFTTATNQKHIYIPCCANTTYTVTKSTTINSVLGIYETSEIPAVGIKFNTLYFSSFANDVQTVTTSENAKFLDIRLNTAITTENEIKEILNSVKIEKGTKATPYSPYNCGNVNFKICNKNINSQGVRLGSYNISNGVYTQPSEQNRYATLKDLLRVKPNFTYTISTKNNINAQFYEIEFDENKTYLNKYSRSTDNQKNHTFTTGQNTYYITVDIRATDSSDYDISYIGDIMIEEESTITSYLAHQEQSFSFPTKEGQVFHKGDYLADDGVHQTRETIELNGTEDWSTQNDAYNTENRILFAANLSSLIQYDKINRKGLCNYFVNSSISVHSAKVDITAFNFNPTSSKYIYFKIEKDKLPTPDVAGWKQWLANKKVEGKPLIVECEIEEIIEPYSPEQQEVWEQIKNAKTYKGTTHIFSEDEISPEFEEEHLVDLEAYINNKLGVQASEPQQEMSSQPSIEQPQIEETEMIGGVE